jgi:hypothetical protein
MTFVGTYGTNGFYLPFTNTTSTTTLGYDSSGNSNNWTTTGFSLTAGSTYDSMNDVPTLTSATASNYAVLNPNDSYPGLLSNGNLTLTSGATGWQTARSSIYVNTGKWYWEVTMVNDNLVFVGLDDNVYDVITNGSSVYVGFYPNSWSIYFSNGYVKNNGGASTAYGSAFSAGDVCMVALDMTNGKVYWGKNGTWFNSGNPATQTNPAFTNLSGYTLGPATSGFDATSIAAHNFGQQPFAYTPPSGFVALNTYNLPTPAIVRGNQYMDVVAYTGTGIQPRVISGLGFQPDWVWLKNRVSAYYHQTYDSVRGTGTGGGVLYTNVTDAVDDTYKLSSFDSNGVTLGTNLGNVNNNNQGIVGWFWKAGNGSNVSNTNGSITSTVSANTTAGFSVVTYTGNSTNNATIGHGLGVAPAMVITKNRVASTYWYVFHSSLPATYNLYLNDVSSQQADNVIRSTNSTTFTVSSSSSANGTSMVAYCFAPIAGFSAFGSYTGNGSADGPFIYLGFRPAFIMIKVSSTTGNWCIEDNKRQGYNSVNDLLYPNGNYAEDSGSSYPSDFVSNGFKTRNTSFNASGATYIYMAFAENPFKYANAR